MKALCIDASIKYGLKPPFSEGETVEVEQHPFFPNDYKITGVVGWSKKRFILVGGMDERKFKRETTKAI